MIFLLLLASVAARGVGFAFSGAGARIAQHAAMMAALVNGTYPGGRPLRPTALAGASSGALTAVMLNAILQTEEQGLADGINMEAYKKLLFAIDGHDIYKAGVLSIAQSVVDGYILDNTPMVKLVASWVNRMGYKTLADLYIPTCLCVVDQDTGFTLHLWSDDPKYGHLDTLQVLMASTALPIAFPTRTIDGLPGTYIDGGTGADTLPISPLLGRSDVDDIYAVTYGSALSSGGAGNLPPPLSSIKLLVNGLAVIADMRVDLFLAALDIGRASNKTVYSYIPKLRKEYSTLDFDHEEEEFDAVQDYCNRHAPVEVHEKLVAQYRRLAKSK